MSHAFASDPRLTSSQLKRGSFVRPRHSIAFSAPGLPLSDHLAEVETASCSNALEYSRMAWRRSPMSSFLDPARESFGASAARVRRLLGTGLSIL
jgi:hypothetical protein